FVRRRHYGVLGNRDRAKRLGSCRTILHVEVPSPPPPASPPALMQRLTGMDIEQCPYCRPGRLRGIATVSGPHASDGRPQTTRPPESERVRGRLSLLSQGLLGPWGRRRACGAHTT